MKNLVILIGILALTCSASADWLEDFESYTTGQDLISPWEDAPESQKLASVEGGQPTGSTRTDQACTTDGAGWNWGSSFRALTGENKITADMYHGAYAYADTGIGMVGHKEVQANNPDIAIVPNATSAGLYADGEAQDRIALQMVDTNDGLGYPYTGPTMVFLAGGKRGDPHPTGEDDPIRNAASILADTWYNIELEKNGLVVTARFKAETDTVWTEWTHTLAADQDFDLNYVVIQERIYHRAGIDNIHATPEPVTLALLTGGGLLALLRKRR